MKLKINEERIKRTTQYDSTYNRGEELFYEDAIQDINCFFDRGDIYPYHVEAYFPNATFGGYQTQTEFNIIGDYAHATCECPAHNPFSGSCQHIVALLLEIQEMQSFGAEIDWFDIRDMHEKRAVLSLIDEYETSIQQASHFLPARASVRFIPKLKYEDGNFVVEASVGERRAYVIKDIFEFMANLEQQKTVSYGKDFEFVHQEQSFTAQSLPVLQFVRAIVQSQQAYTQHNTQKQVGDRRALGLSISEVERLLQLIPNAEIDFVYEYHKAKKVQINQNRPDFQLRIEEQAAGLKLSTTNHEFGLAGQQQTYFFVSTSDIYQLDAHDVRNLAPVMRNLLENEGSLLLSADIIPSFLASVLPRIQSYLDEGSLAYVQATYQTFPLSSTIYLDVNEEQNLEATFTFEYGSEVFKNFTPETDSQIIRDRGKELALEAMLNSVGFAVEKTDTYVLSDDEAIYDFITFGVPQLLSEHQIQVTDRFQQITPQVAKQVQVGVRLESDLMTFKIEDLSFDPAEYENVLAQYKLKKKYHRLKNGSFLNLDSEHLGSFFDLVEDLELSEADLRQEEINLSRSRALYLERMLNKNNIEAKQDAAFTKLITDFQRLEQVEATLPATLQAQLRPYQEIGYHWLKTLANYGLGGILADDMGLGKTVQVIALLCDDVMQGGNKPSLIVAPSSLVYNWKAELAKFAPHLKVLIVNGNASEREQWINQISEYNVIVTSYDLLKRDSKQYDQARFRYAIIDEAHYIKNHTTIGAKSVKKIQSEVRFALTGTPLENSIADVWSLFDFVLPGYLLTYAKFKKQYETPIIKNNDQKLLNRMHALVAPFILRRLKKEVLTELPDKTESIVYCEFDEPQKKLYEATLLQSHQALRSEIAENGENKSRMKMLAMLTRLRQLCCHPALYLEGYQGESAKLSLCLELVQESVESEHQVLIFSQFTSMFEIIGPKLQELGVSYFTLTGETKSEERMKLANRFNNGEAQVFLISLKAGGTGLNLTGADVVIHYDPWWNMSAQNQATDRAHRIGQTSKVQVYKLIAKDTIEEKIEQLQQRKRSLADALVQEGETFITNLSTADIQNLFE